MLYDRCLKDEGEDRDNEDGGVAYQKKLEKILGPKLHLARSIHKLIFLEEQVFD